MGGYKMIIKNKLSKLRKVGVCVNGINGQKFLNGKKSMSFTVYDATPDEVLKVVQKALEQQN